MRVVIARCSVDYQGALQAHLPLATRLLMVKADGSLLVHSDGGSYKPLNWMSPPCTIVEVEPDDDQALAGVSNTQNEATRLQTRFQAGEPGATLEETMVSMQKAQIAFTSAVTVRNRLVSAYTDIMNMNV